MKLILKIAAAGVLVTFVLLAVYLLPAHLQVRDINPELPSAESLRALLDVNNKPTRVSYISTSTQRSEAGVIGHNSVVVEWANGDLLLIDVGMDKSQAIEFGKLMQSIFGGEDPVFNGTVSKLLGDATARVKGVGFTHLHIDHTQGLTDFCNVRGEGALGLQLDYQRELHNFNTEEGADIVAQSCLKPAVLNGVGLLSFDQFPGVAMYSLGGHTPGSTLFAVADGDRLLLFSGDITNSKADLMSNKGKGLVYSLLLVPENTARTARLREWLGKLDGNEDMDVIVSHDIQDMAEILQSF